MYRRARSCPLQAQGTALHIAVVCNFAEVAVLLVESGASGDAANHAGLTPLQASVYVAEKFAENGLPNAAKFSAAAGPVRAAVEAVIQIQSLAFALVFISFSFTTRSSIMRWQLIARFHSFIRRVYLWFRNRTGPSSQSKLSPVSRGI